MATFFDIKLGDSIELLLHFFFVEKKIDAFGARAGSAGTPAGSGCCCSPADTAQYPERCQSRRLATFISFSFFFFFSTGRRGSPPSPQLESKHRLVFFFHINVDQNRRLVARRWLHVGASRIPLLCHLRSGDELHFPP